LVPKVRFYFFPFLTISFLGGYTIMNSFDFILDASQINLNMNSSCKGTVQMYDEAFIQSIGCPNKYITHIKSGKILYSQDCPTHNTGIVWELDLNANNYDKLNQLSCLNLNCCFLIKERRSLKYVEFFLITLLQSIIGFIAAAHCLDLALQNPLSIKAGPSTFSTAKFAF
jgi:hypothetical protein